MKAKIITQADLELNSNLLRGVQVGEIKIFNKINYWNNTMPSGSFSELELENFGFLEYEKPPITEFQRYTTIDKVGNKFIHQIEDFTQEEIDVLNFQKGTILLAHEIDQEFRPNIDFISGIAIESNKEYDEFSGLKTSTEYSNENGELVALKTFTVLKDKENKGTKLTIDYFDKNGNIGHTTVTKDFYSEERIETFKSKCANRVLDRMLFDFKKEIDEMTFFLNNAPEEQVTTFLLQFGIPNKQYLQGILSSVQIMFDDLFKDILISEVLILRNSGDSTDLYNALQTVVYAGFDEIAITSPIGATYRDISLRKFNPNNFNFYE